MSRPPVADATSERIVAALNIAYECSQYDGAHHKAWVIDQMVRALTGDEYDQWVAAYRNSGTYSWDDDETYSWDEGIAP